MDLWESVLADRWTMVAAIAFGIFCVVGIAVETLWSRRQNPEKKGSANPEEGRRRTKE